MKREWENPQIQSQGREVPRATLFPYPTEALALSGERDDCPSFKLLNGTFSLKTVNYGESDTLAESENLTGTYKVRLNQETYPGTYEDMIRFTPNNGADFFDMTVSENNSMHDQWHEYYYSGN